MNKKLDGDSELSLPVWAFITVGLMLLLVGALIALTTATVIVRVLPPIRQLEQVAGPLACDRKHSTDCY